MLTFSMGAKKLLEFVDNGAGRTPTAPAVDGVVRFRSPPPPPPPVPPAPGSTNPLFRIWLFGRRRGFLSRNSTSNRNTALLSGKLIFRLFEPPAITPPPKRCMRFATAGGNSIHVVDTQFNKWISFSECSRSSNGVLQVHVALSRSAEFFLEDRTIRNQFFYSVGQLISCGFFGKLSANPTILIYINLQMRPPI